MLFLYRPVSGGISCPAIPLSLGILADSFHSHWHRPKAGVYIQMPYSIVFLPGSMSVYLVELHKTYFLEGALVLVLYQVTV